MAGREIESINKLANDISIYPQRRSLSTAKLLLFRITLMTIAIGYVIWASTNCIETKLHGIDC